MTVIACYAEYMPQAFQPLLPKIVLAVGAHADDIDFGASATVAKWAKAGAEIHYLVITDGSKGSTDPNMTTETLVKLRQDEQRAAAEFLGAKNVHFFGYEDGMLEVTMELKKKIVALIRELRPDTVISMDPTSVYSAERGTINHPDHRAASQATMDAVFPLARDHMSFPDLFAQGLEPHKVEHLLLINFEQHNYYEDVSDTFPLKHQALRLHPSQFNDQSRAWATTTEIAEKFGAICDCKYAEAFMRLDIPGSS